MRGACFGHNHCGFVLQKSMTRQRRGWTTGMCSNLSSKLRFLSSFILSFYFHVATAKGHCCFYFTECNRSDNSWACFLSLNESISTVLWTFKIPFDFYFDLHAEQMEPCFLASVNSSSCLHFLHTSQYSKSKIEMHVFLWGLCNLVYNCSGVVDD